MTNARFMKVCLDADDPMRVGRFWADLLALELRPASDGECGVYEPDGRCVLWVNQVPESKAAKHRVHLDIYARSVTMLTQLGSAVVRPAGDGRVWTIMADPEGGEYCAFLRDELPPRRLHGLVVDCVDPKRQARWWGEVFGARVIDDEAGYSTLEEVPNMPILTMDFNPVPEPKVAKNRVHWDIAVADVEPLLAAGASMVTPHHGDVEWDVLADPEGNEFCAFARP